MRRNKIIYLTERPSRCTSCGASRVVAHDRIATKYYGPVKVFRCPKCREYFYVYSSNVLRLLAAAGIREHWDDLVQIMGLVALGVPLTQVENLKRRKQETVWTRVEKCRASIPLWNEVKLALKIRWRFLNKDIAKLSSFTPRAKDRDSLFQTAFVSAPTSNFDCSAGLLKLREGFRRKVEQILQRKIAYTGAGELHLADIDAGQIAWVRVIREAHLDQLEQLEERFYQIASQVRHPNEESREIARANALANPTSPVVSLAALCEGFYVKVPLPVFLEDIKGIAKALEHLG